MIPARTAEGILRTTEDYESVRRLALDSGLEDGRFDGIIRVYGYYIGEELVGCVALKLSRGEYSVEWLAVRERDRGKGFGRKLVERVVADAKEQGAKELWALARTPGFFLHMGFVVSPEGNQRGPTVETCRKCPQFNVTCSPKVVAMAL
ncbi:MAG: GNAT family N-acetyltransferase [Methanobacteriota archaeon]|nr:MAG: GNAT family N-acetyltransferase [Euryarchaeota archaeon]